MIAWLWQYVSAACCGMNRMGVMFDRYVGPEVDA